MAIGGGLGASLRHGVGLAAARHLSPAWPHATFAVNMVGSLLMGVLVGWLIAREAGTSEQMRLFFATGLLGGFTTFSAFSLELAEMLRAGEHGKAALYAGGSLAIGVAALFAGLWVARRVFA